MPYFFSFTQNIVQWFIEVCGNKNDQFNRLKSNPFIPTNEEYLISFLKYSFKPIPHATYRIFNLLINRAQFTF
ncbi:hypothetical protein BGP_1362 [Beggiatoa sp. PS]|nr:hypothetical protein BGP_1362 [Beggiatoa sp. PS]